MSTVVYNKKTDFLKIGLNLNGKYFVGLKDKFNFFTKRNNALALF